MRPKEISICIVYKKNPSTSEKRQQLKTPGKLKRRWTYDVKDWTGRVVEVCHGWRETGKLENVVQEMISDLSNKVWNKEEKGK